MISLTALLMTGGALAVAAGVALIAYDISEVAESSRRGILGNTDYTGLIWVLPGLGLFVIGGVLFQSAVSPFLPLLPAG